MGPRSTAMFVSLSYSLFGKTAQAGVAHTHWGSQARLRARVCRSLRLPLSLACSAGDSTAGLHARVRREPFACRCGLRSGSRAIWVHLGARGAVGLCTLGSCGWVSLVHA